MKKSKLYAFLAILMVGSMVLSACAPAATATEAPPVSEGEEPMEETPEEEAPSVGDTLVFMQAAEPISLFCADETDGESLRPCQQVVETLLEYMDDSGDVQPELATSCEPNEDSSVWTCALREGVLFHDGSDFDSLDVVASWAVGLNEGNPYHVGNTGTFDYPAYLWDGLMNVEQTDPAILDAGSCEYGGKVLSIEAVDTYTVVFTLCKSDPAFLAKVAFTPFGIQSADWIAETGGTGEILEHPVGTGPYMVSEWVRGDQIVFTRFDDYWGEPAAAQTAILRWAPEGAARLLELQAGTVHMITNVSPDDEAVVESDPDLVLLPNLNPNIFYVGFTNTFAPFDNVAVRQAIAMGLDRQRIVDNFYPSGSEVASHFTPCSIPNGCAGDSWYDFDVDAANAMLDEAGFERDESGVRFTTSIFYRDVFRVYLPEPGRVAEEIQAQLMENLGIQAEVVQMESGEFIAQGTQGQLDGIHLLGWGADYPHVTNFLDFHFGADNPQFGNAHEAIYSELATASSIGDVDEAEPYYVTANNAIKELVPMIPIAHGASSDAALATLGGAYVPPFGATQFYKLFPPGE